MILALLAAAALSTNSDAWPPIRYQGNVEVVVRIVDPEQIDGLCGKAPRGYETLGCTIDRPKRGPIVILPNPSRSDLSGGDYRKLVAHELGHVAGWPGDHPR